MESVSAFFVLEYRNESIVTVFFWGKKYENIVNNESWKDLNK